MDTIKFIPKEFNNVKLGFYETSKNPCSPGYPLNASDFLWNEIVINVPEKIICNVSDSAFVPVIPICGAYIIGEKRSYKYVDLWANVLHIKSEGDNVWYTGEIIEPNLEYEYPEPYPGEEEDKRRTEEEVKKAQKYSDEEIDKKEGQGAGGFFNVNLLDYIKLPFKTGIYEIFMSTCGLESNRVKVEIVFR
jgi:hypothetical protein